MAKNWCGRSTTTGDVQQVMWSEVMSFGLEGDRRRRDITQDVVEQEWDWSDNQIQDNARWREEKYRSTTGDVAERES